MGNVRYERNNAPVVITVNNIHEFQAFIHGAELAGGGQCHEEDRSLIHGIVDNEFHSNALAGDDLYDAVIAGNVVPYTELKQAFLDTMVVPAFQHDVDSRMSTAFIRETLSKQNISDVRKSFYTDYQAIRGDQIRWCRVTATAVDYDNHGTPVHVLALLQDIDKEKARENDYQAQILKEAHQAKVANNAKTEFLRRISHDIRTPLNGIKGYIERAASHPGDAAMQAHCWEMASTTLHTLLDLVNSILDMSKLENSEIILEEKPFNLATLFQSVNAIILPQAASKQIQYQPHEEIPIANLVGNPRHVSQILVNLVGNAVKYGKFGGYVRLSSRMLSQTDQAVTYEFICEDNSIGMSNEFQQRMFEPFVQESISARTTYEGTGLGLAIVKKLVDAMGGSITCHSQKGIGTTFRVQLTFQIDSTAQNVAQKPQQFSDAVLSGYHLLLVEDNAPNMEIAELLLAEYGAKITKAWNGKGAVDCFSASDPGTFDLILMDIMMPVMNGLEATRTIRPLDRPDEKPFRSRLCQPILSRMTFNRVWMPA